MLRTFLLKRGSNSLLYSLAIKHQQQTGLVNLRSFTIVAASHQNNFHHQKVKCRSNSTEDDLNKTITGFLLSKHSCGKNLLYQQQQTNLFHVSHNKFLAQKVSADEKDSSGGELKAKGAENEKADDDEKPLGLVAKFKKMAKEYWYVLIPVHVVTSTFWFGGFYYASKCGVDIVGMLEYWNFHEKLINPLRDSHLGHIAVAYLLYKIATPARYTVTLGGTTFAIKVLSARGIIKPMPSRQQLVDMMRDKKDDLQQKVSDTKMQFTDKLKKDN